MSSGLKDAILENPFYVLGLGTAASRLEMEREGQKLLGMLELKLNAAATYATPLGPRPRTPELVRTAMAELRDPERRLFHEQLAVLPAAPLAATPPASAPSTLRWPRALRAFGFRVVRDEGDSV